MTKMAKLVSDISKLSSKELDALAQGLAWYSSSPEPQAYNQASALEFFLFAYNREQEAKWAARMNEKEAA